MNKNQTDYRFLDDPDAHARQFIDLLYDDDELLGLFVLEATFPSGACPCGFYLNRDAFFGQVDELNRKGNVYINLNELHHDLYGRSADALKTYAKQRYSDAEVTRRKRLLIDCDPERLSGINSTDAELHLAIERVEQIAAFLQEQWCVEPVLIISGNGAQLLYRIDEPADSNLVVGVLESLSKRFSDDKVHVDTAVSDASRITRLPGAVNMKGSDIPDRPQRYAQILSAPEEVKVVTTEQLARILATPEKSVGDKKLALPDSPALAALASQATGNWTHERIETLLDNEYRAFGGHGWGYKKIHDDKYGWMYEIEQCPFVTHGREFRARIWLNNGIPCYKCFSPDCDKENKKTFGDFRQKIAPTSNEDETDERRLARVFLANYSHPDGHTLRFHKGDFWVWDNYWQKLSSEVLRDRLYASCKADLDRLNQEKTKRIREQIAKDGKNRNIPKVAKVSNNLLASVTTAIKSLVSLDMRPVPCWVEGQHKGEFIAFSDCILDLSAWIERDEQIIYPNTPAYFTPNALDYPFEFTEEPPTDLIKMLAAQEMTEEEIAALQEFGGLCFTPITRFQKAVLIAGPPRSGKGTYERTVTACIGKHNATSKDFNQFNGAHSLEDLPGKTFLGVSDHRQHDSRAVRASVGRLLGIIGEDRQNINPKNQKQYTEKLDVKVMICTNQIPDFHDATDALLSRFIFVKTRHSFAGKEDTGLETRILAARNQATWWFLRGLKRLINRGNFVQPDNGLAAEFKARNAPVQTFVEDRCELVSKAETDKNVLYTEFEDWCEDRGIALVANTDFLQELYAAYGEVRSKRLGGKRGRRYVVSGIQIKGVSEDKKQVQVIRSLPIVGASGASGGTPLSSEQ